MATAIFFAVTFGWSWLLALAATLAWGSDLGAGRLFALAAVFMLGPTLGALAGRWALPREARLGSLGLGQPFQRWGWLVGAWATALGLVALSAVLSRLVPGVEFRSIRVGLQAAAGSGARLPVVPDGLLMALVVGQAALLGSAINAVALLSEELGWRGFLWSRWRRLGFWQSAGATGLVWGVWHAPIIALGHNYPDQPVLGVGLMVVFCLLMAPIIHHLRDRGGTVWHASLFHGTINATAGVGSLVLVAPDWRGNGLVGLGGFTTLALATALVGWARGRRAERLAG